MNTNVIRAAKAIPQHLQKVVSAMFSESDRDLNDAVKELRNALDQVQDYVQTLDGARPARARAGSMAKEPAAKPARRGRRGRRRFGTGDFVVAQLRANPKGLRPRDIAVKLAEAAKGKHSNAVATVNTTLSRLKKAGVARSAGGNWSLTGKSA